MSYVLFGVILFYAAIIICRKIKQFKKGELCDCNCQDCVKCHDNKKEI